MGKTVQLDHVFRPFALKYRPIRFADVAGQESAAQVLKHAVKSSRVHSAYLFHGSRGSGKTSMARIMAKAINCGERQKTPQKFDGEPCGQCNSCMDITQGRSLDVMELDAASHTGVDNVREAILDTINLAPARDSYRVFVIDEVHMLSGSAFNAMLKTLEEPPPNVVFILATTEFAKLPATVVSRTHSFLFRPLSLATVQERLTYIAKQEGIRIDPEAVTEVARAAGGSLRDAISLLQQMVSFSDNTGAQIKHQSVVELLGLVDDAMLVELLNAMAAKPDPAKLKELLETCLYKTGYAPGQLLISLHQKSAQQLVETMDGRYQSVERHLAALIRDIRFMPDPLLFCEAGIMGYLLSGDANREPQIANSKNKEIKAISNKQLAISKNKEGNPLSERPTAYDSPAKKQPITNKGPAVKQATTNDSPAADWEGNCRAFLEAAREAKLNMYLEGCSLAQGDPVALVLANAFYLNGIEQNRDKVLGLWRQFFPNQSLEFRARDSAAPAPKPIAQVVEKEPEPAPQNAEVPDDVKKIAELLGGKVKRKRKA